MTTTTPIEHPLRSALRTAPFALALCLAAVAFSQSAQSAQPIDQPGAKGPAAASADRNLSEPPAHTALRYDFDYPTIGYAGKAKNNPVARLQERLDRGEVKLEFHPPRGYLDSLLKALDVPPSSQTLVYSKTSLQIDVIRAATPRAIYFNDDLYVAWVQGTNLLEFAVMDSVLGQVFYTMANQEGSPAKLDREMQRCLTCHDTFSLMGGGVPRFLFLSSYVGVNGEALTGDVSTETTDETPLQDRWGGWYVTGQPGALKHLGNIQAHSADEFADLDSVRRGNVETLDSLFDTRPYVTNKSDIVALLVFEHQVYVENLITRVNFKARTVLARESGGAATDTRAWEEMSPRTQVALKAMMEPLVRAMLFVGATELTSKVAGNSGFDAWFQARGPRDRRGRSLRELDLNTRLFKYPLSYVVYSEAFNGLPEYAKSYIYGRFADILTGRDESPAYAHLSATDRKALLEILTDTRPGFAKVAAETQKVRLSRRD